jgi:alkaline phosphatase D
LLGNQVIFSPWKDPKDHKILSPDAWDGYQATRYRLASVVRENAVENLVILSGDVHMSMAFDVKLDPWSRETSPSGAANEAFAVELVCPAVTSPALEGNPIARVAPAAAKLANPHCSWIEVTRKGYVLVDLTPERMQAEWYFVVDHKRRIEGETLGAAFRCESGTARLVATKESSVPKPTPRSAVLEAR